MAKSIKKLLSLVIVVVMVLSMIPAVSATEEQEIDETFQISKLSELTAVLKSDSAQNLVANATYKFVLQEDITVNIAGALYIGDYVSGTGGHGVNVIIDLNNHTLTDAYSGTKNRLFAAYEGSSLTVMNGKIVSNTNYKSKGGMFFGEGGSDFTFDNVTVEITSPNTSQGGVLFAAGSGAVVTLNDSTFTRTAGDCADHGGMIAMSGGQLNLNNSHISGGRVVATETGDPSLGGNIYLEAGAVATMNGGSITNGYVEGKTATDIPPASGGNIYVNGTKTKFILNSGTISGGEAKITGTGYCTGGNVGLDGTSSSSRAYFVMNGGQVINGKATYGTGGSSTHRRGANFGLYEACNLTINDGLVQGGDTAYRGTNIDMWTTSCAAEINGGTITGGGIYITGQLLVKGGLLDQAGITNGSTYVSYVRVYGGTILHSGGFSKAFGGNKATSSSGGSTGWVSTTYIYGGKMNFAPQTLYGDKVDATTGEVTSVMYRGVVEGCSEVIAPAAGEELYVVKHKDNDTSVTVPATCTEKGSVKTTCTSCDFNRYEMKFDGKYTYEIPALGHDYVGTQTQAPTCTADGEMTYVCKNDANHTYTEAVPATGHTPGEPVTENEKANSCTADGSYDTVVYCTVCNAEISRKTNTVSAAGHTEEIIPGKAATCTESGLTEGKKCTVCGTVTVAQNEIPAIGHKYEETKTDATFESDAFTTYTCSVCGDSYIETEEGTKLTAVATADGVPFETLEEALAAGGQIVLLANGEAAQVRTDIDLNGFTLKADVYGKLTLNGGTLITPQGYKMIGPDATYYISTDAVLTMDGPTGDITIHSGKLTLAQSWWTGAGQILSIEAAASFEIPEGMSLNVLSTVIAEGQLTIAGTANLYTKDAVIYAPEGLNVTTTAGDKVLYAEGAYKAHSHVAGEKVTENEVANSCTADGSYDEVIYCSVCGDELSRETTTVPASGHKYEGVYTEPTYEADGYTTYTCSVCGDSYVDTDEGTKLTAVAQIGETKYGTLAGAVEAAAEGDTIVVLTNVVLTETLVIPAEKTVILDLAGCTVSMEDASGKAAQLIKNNGSLTVMDSREGGKLTFLSTTPSANYGYSTSTIVNAGDLKIVSGTVESTTNGGASYAIDNAWYTKDVTLTVEGGTVKAVRIAIRQVLFSTTAKNTVNIINGVIDSGYAGLQVHNFQTTACLSDVNISGGTFNGTYAFYTSYSYNNTATGTDIEISGGTFNGYVFLYNGNAGSDAYPMTISVTGGTFNDGYYAYCKDADSAEVSIPSVTGGTFAYDVSDYCTEDSISVENSDGNYTVVKKAYAKILSQPIDWEGEVNTVAEFTVEATGDGLVYRWEYSQGNNWYNTKMDGFDTATLTVPMLLTRDGYRYRCIITDAYGTSVTTEPATLTVNQPAGLVQIVNQPDGVEVVAGMDAIFTVEAAGDGLQYQWQYTKNGTNWYYTGMTGAKTSQLTVTATAARDGYQYRCVITDAYGTSVTTEAAALTVTEKQITTSGPADQVAVDGTAVFTVNVEGEGLIYKWQYQRADGTKWFYTTMEGYATDTLTVTATVARNGYKYRCIVTDAYGNETVSEEAVLTVE